MINLNKMTEFRDYFSTLATQHNDIDAFIFGDDEQLDAASRSSGSTGRILWMEPHQPVPIQDNGHDTYLARKISSGALMIRKEGDYNNEAALYEQAEEIVLQILARILKDYQEDQLLLEPRSMKYGWAEITSGSSSFVGCRFDFTLQTGVNLVYNEQKWTP